MPDTRRELATLQTSLADNSAGAITAQNARDVLISNHPSQVTQSAAYASEPATGQVTGDLFLPSDGAFAERWNGSAWKPFGPLFPLTKPADPGTWVNQGSATVGTAGGPFYMTCVASGSANSAKVRVKSAPATPYTVSALIGTVFNPYDSGLSGLADAGLVFRESGTGKLITFGQQQFYNQTNKLILAKWDSATSLNSTYGNVASFLPTGSTYWVRIKADGTNLVWYISADGQNWLQIDSRAKANFFTTAPDQIGYYLNPFSAGVGLSVLGSDL